MNTYSDLRTAIEVVSARRLYLIENHNACTMKDELDALAVVINSLRQWVKEYEASSPLIDEFIASYQFRLRLESNFGGTPR